MKYIKQRDKDYHILYKLLYIIADHKTFDDKTFKNILLSINLVLQDQLHLIWTFLRISMGSLVQDAQGCFNITHKDTTYNPLTGLCYILKDCRGDPS